jgi:SAM-dependent methyltransferase
VKALLINIGCGGTWHPDWMNFDVRPAHPAVYTLDARAGLPFETGTVDACYSSHVLEHLRKDDARKFLSECARVLRPGGTLRIVVPNLEAMAREYLGLLEELRGGSLAREADYSWILLELFDQVVRNYSGGEMGRQLARADLPNRAYILSRIGRSACSRPEASATRSPILERLKRGSIRDIAARGRLRLATVAARWIAGRSAAAALRVGTFRASGEVHECMYDSYSLSRLLISAGFTEIRECGAQESDIPAFSRYGLDVVEGEARKPDSLYMEARRL